MNPGKVIQTKYGKVQGIPERGCIVYKGIPYAKPPVGELRWKAPEAPEAWDGIYQAVHFSCKSMQEDKEIVEVQEGDEVPFYEKEFHDTADFEVKPSEDSLYLNIWTPEKTDAEKLPVLFWIHGGAFQNGYGSEKEFDGEGYCRRGVILVTINYRLNIFGFLAHPWLNEENSQGVSGNYGILDQIAALRWVYENIEAFGGDKERITIMGQSAGAMSVQTLVSSPLTNDMIKGAILQSAGGYQNGIMKDLPAWRALEYGKEFAALTGARSISELREKSVEELYEAYDKFLKADVQREDMLLMQPNIDGYVMPEGYDTLIEKGKVKKIPYMIGSTRHDLFIPREEADAGIESTLYKGCVNWSSKLQEAGFLPSYVYYFTRELPGDHAGAFHSSELWYMFGTWKRCWRPFEEQDEKLSEKMMDYWANFVKTGNPNGENTEEDSLWRPCTIQDKFVKQLDIS